MNKLMMAAALMMAAGMAQAEESIYGQLATSPQNISVVDDKGNISEYQFSASINTGYAKGDMLSLTVNGLSAKCGDYLGQLAKDYTVNIKDKKTGERVSITYAAADESTGRTVSVYGMCEEGTNILTQMDINVKSGAEAVIGSQPEKKKKEFFVVRGKAEVSLGHGNYFDVFIEGNIVDKSANVDESIFGGKTVAVSTDLDIINCTDGVYVIGADDITGNDAIPVRLVLSSFCAD